MKLRYFLIVLMCVLFIAPDAAAQRRKLKEGDDAPGLKVEEWLNTDGEVTIENGSAYVVVFMDNDTFNTEKGLEALIVNAALLAEAPSGSLNVIVIADEKGRTVKEFAAGMKYASETFLFDIEEIKFNIAVDKKGGTERAWMGAAKLKEKPTAFVIDKSGKIAWIASAFDDLYLGIVYRVVVDRWDYKKVKDAGKYITQAERDRRIKNWRMAAKFYDQVVESDPRTFWVEAIDKFEMLLIEKQRPEEAYAYADEMVNGIYAEDELFHADLAELIAQDPRLEALIKRSDDDDITPERYRNLDLALASAEKASEMALHENPELLTVLARVHQRRGELDTAVDLQRKAYMLARPWWKEEYKRVWQEFKQQQTQMRQSNARLQ